MLRDLKGWRRSWFCHIPWFPRTESWVICQVLTTSSWHTRQHNLDIIQYNLTNTGTVYFCIVCASLKNTWWVFLGYLQESTFHLYLFPSRKWAQFQRQKSLSLEHVVGSLKGLDLLCMGTHILCCALRCSDLLSMGTKVLCPSLLCSDSEVLCSLWYAVVCPHVICTVLCSVLCGMLR